MYASSYSWSKTMAANRWLDTTVHNIEAREWCYSLRRKTLLENARKNTTQEILQHESPKSSKFSKVLIGSILLNICTEWFKIFFMIPSLESKTWTPDAGPRRIVMAGINGKIFNWNWKTVPTSVQSWNWIWKTVPKEFR